MKIHVVLIICFMFTSLLGMTFYFSRHQRCSATDDALTAPVFKTYSSFTKDNACRKAVVICSYYSPNPSHCKILK